MSLAVKLILSIFVFLLASCGGGSSENSEAQESNGTVDNIPPNILKLVSASSIDIDKISLDWLPGKDDKTPHEQLKYSIHIATESDLKPNQNNFNKTVTGKITEVVDGLDPNTVYYVRIVVEDDDRERSWSNILEVKTVATPVKRTSVKVIAQEISQISQVSEDSIILKDDGRDHPKPGEIMVSQEGNGYLRKVTEVTLDNGNIIAKTESAALNEIFEELEFSTTVKLENIDEVPVSSTKSAARSKGGLSGRSLNGVKEIHWPESGLTMTDPNIKSRQQISRRSLLTRSTSILDDKDKNQQLHIRGEKYSKLTAPAYIAVNPNEDVAFDVIAETLYPDENIYQICDLTLTNFHHDDSQLKKLKWPSVGTMLSSDSEQRGELNLRWNFSENYVHKDGLPYTAIFTANIFEKKDNCKGESREDIDIQVPVYIIVGNYEGEKITEELDFSAEASASANIDAKATTTFDFRPELVINAKIQSSKLQTAQLTAKANVEFETKLELKAGAEGDIKAELALLKPKKFVRILQAGPVPIVVRGEFGIKAKFTGNATGTIDVKEIFNLSFPDAEYGLTYDRNRKQGEKWQIVSHFDPVYRFELTGDADAEANIELRLIPDMQIHFYEAASGRMLVEPYLYGKMDVHGQFRTLLTVDSESTEYGDDADYWFNQLAAGGGVDLRFYAGLDIFDINVAGYPEEAKSVKDIDNFRLFTPIDETDIWSLPKLKASQDLIEINPEDSRSIRILGLSKDLEFPFKENYSLNPFEAWLDPKVLEENEVQVSRNIATIEKIDGDANDTSEENSPLINFQGFWFTPTKPGEYKLRIIGHSEIGELFRQVVDFDVILLDDDNDGMLDYWEERYKVKRPNIDEDCDGLNNLEEFNQGSDPKDGAENCEPSFSVQGVELILKHNIKNYSNGEFVPFYDEDTVFTLSSKDDLINLLPGNSTNTRSLFGSASGIVVKAGDGEDILEIASPLVVTDEVVYTADKSEMEIHNVEFLKVDARNDFIHILDLGKTYDTNAWLDYSALETPITFELSVDNELTINHRSGKDNVLQSGGIIGTAHGDLFKVAPLRVWSGKGNDVFTYDTYVYKTDDAIVEKLMELYSFEEYLKTLTPKEYFEYLDYLILPDSNIHAGYDDYLNAKGFESGILNNENSGVNISKPIIHFTGGIDTFRGPPRAFSHTKFILPSGIQPADLSYEDVHSKTGKTTVLVLDSDGYPVVTEDGREIVKTVPLYIYDSELVIGELGKLVVPGCRFTTDPGSLNYLNKSRCFDKANIILNDGRQLKFTQYKPELKYEVLEGVSIEPNKIYGATPFKDEYGGPGNDEINLDFVNSSSLKGGAGDDKITSGVLDNRLINIDAGYGNDEIFDDPGSDENIYGAFGDDKLYSQGGYDRLYGGFGDDKYFVTLDEYEDYIVDTGGFDTLYFESPVKKEDLMFTRSECDLTISSQNASIYLPNFFSTLYERKIEQLGFTDGSFYLFDSVTVTDEIDKATGEAIECTNDGMIGYYTLAGDENDNVFLYSGGKAVVIDTESSDSDTLQFAEGIAIDDLWIQQSSVGNPDLTLKFVNNDTDYIKIEKQRNSSTINIFEFSDGSTFTSSELLSYLARDPRSTQPSNGEDYLVGNDENNIINGIAGNDTILGGAGNDTLNGGNGDDIVDGGTGNNIIIGGAGNDELRGQDGNDIYRFNLGLDTLSDTGGNDVLHITGGLTITDVVVKNAWPDLKVIINEGVDEITLQQQLCDICPDKVVELLTFDDGSEYQLNVDISIFDKTWIYGKFTQNFITSGNTAFSYVFTKDGDDQLTGNTGDDIIYAGGGRDDIDSLEGNDILYAGNGDDVIKAGSGDDVIYPQTGNDVIHGGTGSDTYYYENGNDNIYDIGGAGDTLYIPVNVDTVTFATHLETDLILMINGVSDSVIIRNYFSVGEDKPIEWIKFSDTDLVSLEQVRQGTVENDPIGPLNLLGTTGNDTLTGTEKDDQFNGGLGSDQLNGLGGNDFYKYTGGIDTIRDTAGDDTLLISSGYKPTDIVTSIDDNLSIKINLSEGVNEIEIAGANLMSSEFESTGGRIELITFDDGSTLHIGNPLSHNQTWRYGTASDDTFSLNSSYINEPHNLFGRTGNDHLQTGAANDALFGEDGDDYLDAGEGNDLLVGGAGNDSLLGGSGNDFLKGGLGGDYLYGNAGDDTYYYSGGRDSFNELNSDETNVGGMDTIRLSEAFTTDSIKQVTMGMTGGVADRATIVFVDNLHELILHNFHYTNSELHFEQFIFGDGRVMNADLLRNKSSLTFSNPDEDNTAWVAGSDPFIFFAGKGNDDIRGSSNDDVFYGGSGNDKLTGDNGHDTFIGETGNDHQIGGLGGDLYIYRVGDGSDTILDKGGVDSLDLTEGIVREDLTFSRVGDNLIIHIGSESITIQDHYLNPEDPAIDYINLDSGNDWIDLVVDDIPLN